MNRRSFISSYTRINRKYETLYFPKVKRAIHSKVKAVISRLRNSGIDAARNYLLQDTANEAMTQVITDLYTQVGKKHAQESYLRIRDELSGKKSFFGLFQQKRFGFNDEWVKFILNYLQRHLTSKITFEINHTTREALLKALGRMINEGLSIDQMIEKLEDWPFERFQAARIVRTEVNRAANVGSSAQASTSEYWQMKEWISVHDNRTRGQKPHDHANHIALDGVKIDEGDQFTDSINGDRLDFPGDPSASAASVVNCRCAVAYSLKRDQNGNPIRKRQSTVILYPKPRSQKPIVTV